MIEIINKYGVYGKYIFLICMIICIIFFLKKKGIMSENKFKPLSTIMILGIILFVGVGITVITIATMKVYGIALNTEIILMKAM